MLIAKNLTKYTISSIPSDFWSKWKADKSAMRAEGYSPFKRDDGWYLAHYTNEKATAEEYKEYNSARVKSFFEYLSLEPTTAAEEAVCEMILDSENVEEAEKIIFAYSNLFENAKALVNSAREGMFIDDFNNCLKEI